MAVGGQTLGAGLYAPSIDLPEEAGGDLDAVQGALKVTGLNQPYRVESASTGCRRSTAFG